MMPGDELHVIRWHAEPVRAAHHRRTGFAIGLVLGIVLGALAVASVRAAAPRSAQPVIADWQWRQVAPATAGQIEVSSSWGDPSFPAVPAAKAAEPTAPHRAASVPGLILDPFPVSPPPERAAVTVPSPELRVVSKAPAGGSVAAARAHARSVLGAAQFECFDVLMARESNWNPRAYNAVSGAYGIPQAVPGSKMAAYGADWRTNPVTQVRWGIAYVAARYGTACAALSHSYAVGWY